MDGQRKGEREINRLSVQQWLRSAIPDSRPRTSPIGFLFLKLPPPPCAVLLVIIIMRIINDNKNDNKQNNNNDNIYNK